MSSAAAELFAPPPDSPPSRLRAFEAAAMDRDRLRSHLPPAIQAAVWSADQIATRTGDVIGTGFPALDAELPGGGWPCNSLTEVLQAQPTVAEWRLLGRAMRTVIDGGKTIVIVGPPKAPHLPGLRQIGIDERRLVWIDCGAPSERLWVTEQLIKSGACGLVLAWLPQCRQEQVRRLQVCSLACRAPVVLFRPLTARHEASAAPLRLTLQMGVDWELLVQVVKRQGPAHEALLRLPSVPGGLRLVMAPRLRRPSELIAARGGVNDVNQEVVPDAMGSAASRHAAAARSSAH